MINNCRQLKSGLLANRFGIALALSLSITTVAGYFLIAEQSVDAVMPVRHITPATVPIPVRTSEPPRAVAKLTVPDPVVVQSAPSVVPDSRQDRNNVVSNAQSAGVLHISNVGDRIVVSHEPRKASASAAPQSGSKHVVPTARDESAPTGQAAPLSDYEDVYPGCPRVLPQGADEQMVQQRQELYGCQYSQSCELASEENAASCTWYLVGKI